MKIGFCGDLMLGGQLEEIIFNKGIQYERLFAKISERLANVDVIVANLETTLSKNGKQREGKTSILYSPPHSLEALRTLNCSIVNLANNHIMDYGERGLTNTQKILLGNGLRFFGAGKDISEASKPLIINKRGVRIAFLGYTTNAPEVKSIIATNRTPGCPNIDLGRIKNDIESVRLESDVVLVSLHWGLEYFSYPSPEQRKVARQIIDLGASAIIGHHPHVLQGVELYKGSPIFYSIGNFFFPDFMYSFPRHGFLHKWPEISKYGMIVVFCISKTKNINFELIPTLQKSNWEIEVGNPVRLNLKIDRLSKPFLFSNKQYETFWNNYKRKRYQTIKEWQKNAKVFMIKQLPVLFLDSLRKKQMNSLKKLLCFIYMRFLT